MAKKLMLLCIAVSAISIMLAATVSVQGKAHVPLDRVQICTGGGEVRNIAIRNMQNTVVNGGACRLTQCVFNKIDDEDNLVQQFIFLPGDDCDPTDKNGDGFCDATGAPGDIPKNLKANNVTPACTSTF